MEHTDNTHKLSPAVLRALYRHVSYHNLKIPLFYGLLCGAGYVAWTTSSVWVEWLMYGAMGYLWMSIVTFMHDCTHGVLFKARWKNWVFGMFSILPLIITFIAFKEDHLEHHRYNRSPKDPDAFTMGQRTLGDFLLFYAYVLVGGVLTILQFVLLYPAQKFRGEKLALHCSVTRPTVFSGTILTTTSGTTSTRACRGTISKSYTPRSHRSLSAGAPSWSAAIWPCSGAPACEALSPENGTRRCGPIGSHRCRPRLVHARPFTRKDMTRRLHGGSVAHAPRR